MAAESRKMEDQRKLSQTNGGVSEERPCVPFVFFPPCFPVMIPWSSFTVSKFYVLSYLSWNAAGKMLDHSGFPELAAINEE